MVLAHRFLVMVFGMDVPYLFVTTDFVHFVGAFLCLCPADFKFQGSCGKRVMLAIPTDHHNSMSFFERCHAMYSDIYNL